MTENCWRAFVTSASSTNGTWISNRSHPPQPCSRRTWYMWWVLWFHLPLQAPINFVSDSCMTSLLSAAWMCQHCGWETCDECYQVQYTVNADAVNSIPRNACTSTSLGFKKEGTGIKKRTKIQKVKRGATTTISETEDEIPLFRTTEDFIPISRFLPGELEDLIKTINSLPEPHATSEYVPSQKIRAAMAQATAEWEAIRIPSHEITNELLDHLWSPEDPYPFVVTDVTRYLQYNFNPAFFREHDVLGTQECTVQNCQTGKEFKCSVAEFFSNYGDESEDKQPLCLKVSLPIKHYTRHEFIYNYLFQDWPPSSHFKTTFPFSQLYPEIAKILPLMDYTLLDGCLNIATYFPDTPAKSDLGILCNSTDVWRSLIGHVVIGPKMYNALRDIFGCGSTKLHMDVADAWNINLFGIPGDKPAIWLVFCRNDAERLACALRKLDIRNWISREGNPILQHRVFLTSADLEFLAGEGIRPYVINQRLGDMVFIPAGCPHQVRFLDNLGCKIRCKIRGCIG